MKRVVQLLISERSVVGVIIFNTVALLVMGYADPDLVLPGEVPHRTSHMVYQTARWVDFACVVYFLLEVLLKVRTFGFRRYWASGWNRFDFVVVMLSSPLLLSPLLDLDELTVVLALRLGRLFRLFRLMRFIPNREHLYLGMKRALRASVGVFLALLLINIVLSLGATQLFGRQAPEYFGNPALSSYSLFQVFTLEGWYEIPALIASRAHPAVALLARIYFVVAVMLGGILGLSLANAVFVDEMTSDNTRAVEAKMDRLLEEVRALRQQADERER